MNAIQLKKLEVLSNPETKQPLGWFCEEWKSVREPHEKPFNQKGVSSIPCLNQGRYTQSRNQTPEVIGKCTSATPDSLGENIFFRSILLVHSYSTSSR